MTVISLTILLRLGIKLNVTSFNNYHNLQLATHNFISAYFMQSVAYMSSYRQLL